MRIRIITNGYDMYLVPKGKRLPAGNFEIGPKDSNGRRHTVGIFHVDHIHDDLQIAEETIPTLPTTWL